MSRNHLAQENDPPASEASVCTVLIEPRDPLIFRDARPFAAEPGARAFCLPFPYPRTVAGTLRTHIGNTATEQIDWRSRDQTRRAGQIVVHGPLLAGKDARDADWKIHVPAPRDVVFHRDECKALRAMILRPRDLDTGANYGCNLPERPPGDPANGYERALANTHVSPMHITEDVKPEQGVPAWWRLDDAVRWLSAPEGREEHLPFTGPTPKDRTVRGMAQLDHDTRTHVSIDPKTLVHREGALFTTESLVFPELSIEPGNTGTSTPAAAMLCRVESNIAWKHDDALVPLGGERRLARLHFEEHGSAWPKPVFPSREQFAAADGLRLLLVTPAIFSHGWLPGWMADATIPGLAGLGAQVTLTGAAIERRVPVSGWGITRKEGAGGKEAGARATRYAVPAGGVYFFRFTKGAPDPDLWKIIWERLWLNPVADRQTDRESGFGLVLPGLSRTPANITDTEAERG